MKLIGFAAGPLHIICINEYIKKFKIKSYEIYLFNNKTDLVNKQINITVDFLKFIPIMFFNTPSTKDNLPTIIFFTTLIFFDVFWNTNIFRYIKELLQVDTKYCYTFKQTGFAYLIGILIGVIWANIIYSMKNPELQYFPEYKNNEMCKKASSTKYKCSVYKNGELVKNLN